MQGGRSVPSWLQIPSRRGECKTRQATTILAQGETKAERPWLHSATDVAVVESADLRHCHDIAALGLLDRAWLGRVLPESEMRARGVMARPRAGLLSLVRAGRKRRAGRTPLIGPMAAARRPVGLAVHDPPRFTRS